jgi:hypothetical protein
VVTYFNLEEVRKDAQSLVGGWKLLTENTSIEIEIGIVKKHVLFISVVIGEDLLAEIYVNGIPMREKVSVEKKRLNKLIMELSELRVCNGICDAELQQFVPVSECRSKAFYRQIGNVWLDGDFQIRSFIMTQQCRRLIPEGDVMCKSCKRIKYQLLRKKRRRRVAENGEIKSKTPLSSLAKSSLKRALLRVRNEAKILKNDLRRIRKKIEQESVPISDEMHSSLLSVMEDKKMNTFVRLFWGEQQKSFQRNSKGMRWHPMMLRFAILLHSQSPAAYEVLKETGVLKLPNERTLRDYSNFIQPQTGFNPAVLEDIRKEAENFSDNQRWVVLMHDEMSIKSNLVYDRASGELVGFVDSQNWTSKRKDENEIGTHVLVFMIVGVASSLKMSLGYFCTKSATANDIYPWFWDAVGYLETYCQLKVILNNNFSSKSV